MSTHIQSRTHAHMDYGIRYCAHAGMTAMINMYNVRQFLEDGRFETSAAAQAGGVPKQASMTIKRTALKPAGKSVPYEVTEKPPPKVRENVCVQKVARFVRSPKRRKSERCDCAACMREVMGKPPPKVCVTMGPWANAASQHTTCKCIQ